eukprot:CAMPEP_0185752998 /NCGR_PEP_ID=MMETSP1174-20130828/11763_1 /TAXON_ID=35687 /ORGANISM="Dictyocha speculum, Strain CCMP1381" /LENGTH=348 /DNA_ID=CAMNT_0028430675 /DNA_START=142 /DNA_END=1188 /DNA_ORIENTATION=+
MKIFLLIATLAHAFVPELPFPRGLSPRVALICAVPESANDFESLSYRELQVECKTRGLAATGKKANLLERLIQQQQGDFGAVDSPMASASPSILSDSSELYQGSASAPPTDWSKIAPVFPVEVDGPPSEARGGRGAISDLEDFLLSTLENNDESGGARVDGQMPAPSDQSMGEAIADPLSDLGTLKDDDHFMNLAMQQADLAAKNGEVPVGAILVAEDGFTVLSEAHNLVASNNDPTAHAEIIAIREACQRVENWRLNGATLYCTLEPCAMCLSAVQSARVRRLVYGAPDLRMGAVCSRLNLLEHDHPFHPHMLVEGGIQQNASASMLREFFRRRRRETQEQRAQGWE